ncbi:uncharacterized protein PGTG_11210 [Puccinia graminis f. sp. tritici CRL 75-36-700-3]|uniref:Zinc-finger domain-containing protein n=1 Tax=Puccinia graminis f. sp. tritici (strain CRL 75-36-700-3 / race SCCL) TaxID=418459 RepID=E3KL66_PUCGT|nr:uncharacterized protein PGTG_11210 [Puccinia graminis f. sp. tritici CRL 75-36-700-3]EFP85041.1 hypothetical protein PGTG_11210 [Puccinia graminis f. sp. tritici CRL 75-36-700-3]
MPKLRGPLFKFVPGGKILCMKCRNICPCASCRRARGERGVMGNGLNGFYDLMRDETKTEAPLRKTKRKEREQVKPSRLDKVHVPRPSRRLSFRWTRYTYLETGEPGGVPPGCVTSASLGRGEKKGKKRVP